MFLCANRRCIKFLVSCIFCCMTFQVKRQRDSVDDVDDGVETYDYNNANDLENFCPCPEVML